MSWFKKAAEHAREVESDSPVVIVNVGGVPLAISRKAIESDFVRDFVRSAVEACGNGGAPRHPPLPTP